jgi:L-erythrulose 1-phosphate isomerase
LIFLSLIEIFFTLNNGCQTQTFLRNRNLLSVGVSGWLSKAAAITLAGWLGQVGLGGQALSKSRPFIGTSWKMNKTRDDARQFCSALARSPLASVEDVQLFVIPPFPYIAEAAEIFAQTKVLTGAQNMHWQDHGAWTGEVSPLMLKDCGAQLVEIGHSERRTHFGETDEKVALKTAAAIRHGLIPLVCIGDTREEYDSRKTAEALERQTRALLRDVSREEVSKVVIAYEPVWSIGEGGTPASPEFANDQHRRIKQLTKVITGHELRVLYGGSVNPGNCVALSREANIDGLFIGRSAWDIEGYLGIVKSVLEASGEDT